MIALALGVFYIPILVALIFLSRNLRRKLITSPDGTAINSRTSKTVVAIGAILATVLALLAAYLVPDKGGELNLNALLMRIAFTLAVPFVLGFLFVQLARIWPSGFGGPHASIVVNRLGIGAFHAIWFLPVLLIAAFQILSLLTVFITGSWRW